MVRLQVEINENRFGEIEDLMKDCGLRTKKDLFNNAITLFKWAVNQRKSGAEIVAVNEDNKTYKQLEMPALSAVQRKS